MSNYVLTYHGGAGMPESAEEVEQVMAAWGAWFETIGADVVDGGSPLGEAATLSADRSTSEGRAIDVTGYSIITADSLESAIAHAKGCPVLDNGGTVQVSEAMEM